MLGEVSPLIISKIKELMKDQKVTIKDLQSRTGLSGETLLRARDERFVKCRVETLEVIAKALGVRLVDLFEEK